MNVSGEKSRSVWGLPQVDAPRLTENVDADVVVIGSGIAGMSVAYELTKAGQRVVVVDRGPIGGGMTSRTTAHLSDYSDDGFRELIKMRGLDAARGWRQSQAAAVARIEAISQELASSCNFRRLDGFLFLAPGSDASIIDDELVACGQVGMPAVKHDGVPFAGHDATPALRFPNQATFHPTKYLNALAGAIVQGGGRLYSGAAVTKVEEDEAGVTATTTDGLLIEARDAVVATNAPINDRFAISSKQAPYRTYVVAFEIARGVLPDGLYWDTLDPYHYVRLQEGAGDSDILIVGGEDHKTGESDDGDDHILALTSWTQALVPDVGREVARWSGQVLEPMDYVAFIGRYPADRHIYVATGDSGQGITHGALAGMLISDLILRGESEWTSVYEPGRKPLAAATEFLKENATAVKSYADYLGPGDISSLDDLQPGEGAIIREGMQKIAAYRDEGGALSLCSAACAHLGCLLRWNSFERCWDCPCHGSQFSPDGEPLNGPAAHPLAKIQR